MRMSELRRGDRGTVLGISPHGPEQQGAIAHDELERRLLEIGFVEGARFQILHEGLIGRDPIALKLNDMRVAMRRREARVIAVELDRPAGPGR